MHLRWPPRMRLSPTFSTTPTAGHASPPEQLVRFKDGGSIVCAMRATWSRPSMLRRAPPSSSTLIEALALEVRVPPGLCLPTPEVLPRGDEVESSIAEDVPSEDGWVRWEDAEQELRDEAVWGSVTLDRDSPTSMAADGRSDYEKLG